MSRKDRSYSVPGLGCKVGDQTLPIENLPEVVGLPQHYAVGHCYETRQHPKSAFLSVCCELIADYRGRDDLRPGGSTGILRIPLGDASVRRRRKFLFNWAPVHNVCSVVVTLLESRRATSCGYNSSHPVWYALYECLQDIHGDSSPFLLQPFHEFSNGFWLHLTSPHTQRSSRCNSSLSDTDPMTSARSPLQICGHSQRGKGRGKSCKDELASKDRFSDVYYAHRFELWKRLIAPPKCKELNNDDIYKKLKNCSWHFGKECFNPGMKRLNPNSVPNLNLPGHSPLLSWGPLAPDVRGQRSDDPAKRRLTATVTGSIVLVYRNNGTGVFLENIAQTIAHAPACLRPTVHSVNIGYEYEWVFDSASHPQKCSMNRILANIFLVTTVVPLCDFSNLGPTVSLYNTRKHLLLSGINEPLSTEMDDRHESIKTCRLRDSGTWYQGAVPSQCDLYQTQINRPLFPFGRRVHASRLQQGCLAVIGTPRRKKCLINSEPVDLPYMYHAASASSVILYTKNVPGSYKFITYTFFVANRPSRLNSDVNVKRACKMTLRLQPSRRWVPYSLLEVLEELHGHEQVVEDEGLQVSPQRASDPVDGLRLYVDLRRRRLVLLSVADILEGLLRAAAIVALPLVAAVRRRRRRRPLQLADEVAHRTRAHRLLITVPEKFQNTTWRRAITSVRTHFPGFAVATRTEANRCTLLQFDPLVCYRCVVVFTPPLLQVSRDAGSANHVSWDLPASRMQLCATVPTATHFQSRPSGFGVGDPSLLKRRVVILSGGGVLA
ncbi:hypothetical protein PR048_017760 [Dryococelus australis]|uniref:Uncharacterized protein n=1 Tax=Dryococelus australis TaxID=614101 RepID=A0ABQ9HAE1_9NEOP|nr:hypothetical protein PR048_017760 [Dryococelus australis]